MPNFNARSLIVKVLQTDTYDRVNFEFIILNGKTGVDFIFL